jgi:aldehyde dehydrogenase (NAD+)
LELGGKSPCIVDKTANLELTAKRLVFGKYLNAGQTCVAPDYLLVHSSVKDELMQYIKAYIKKYFGIDPISNDDYPKIINEKHFNRINRLITGEKIILGGKSNLEKLKIEPTILDNISAESPVMQEEIFGPVLPVITFETIDDAEDFIGVREKPLALYLFTTDRNVERRILKNLSFGGGCINDTIIHLASSRMGFGGIGGSGMGSYHGKLSFDTFSHYKSIVKKYNWIDLPIRYHPYTHTKEKLLRLFLK